MANPARIRMLAIPATSRSSEATRLAYGRSMSSPTAGARERLVRELREHALVIGEVTLTSGRKAQYYVDAKRAILLPAGFRALGTLVAAEAERTGATAVGGMTMGADPVACA